MNWTDKSKLSAVLFRTNISFKATVSQDGLGII